MTNPAFVYTTYIRTTPEKLWSAITNPEFTRQYWGGMENVSDWKKGSQWKHVGNDEKHTVRVIGEVVESMPPNRLVLTWVDPDNRSDSSRVTYEIKPADDVVCLTIVHDNFTAGSDMKGKVSMGWPLVLSSLKSFLETGTPLNVQCVKSHS